MQQLNRLIINFKSVFENGLIFFIYFVGIISLINE